MVAHGSTTATVDDLDLVLRTGEACSLPATKPVAKYEVEVVDGDVAVVLP